MTYFIRVVFDVILLGYMRWTLELVSYDYATAPPNCVYSYDTTWRRIDPLRTATWDASIPIDPFVELYPPASVNFHRIRTP